MQIPRSSWYGIPVCLFHILPPLPQHGRDEFHGLHWQMLLFVEHPLVLVFRDVGHHWLSVCLITSQKLLWAFRSWDIFSAPPKHINLILNDKIFQEFRHASWPVFQEVGSWKFMRLKEMYYHSRKMISNILFSPEIFSVLNIFLVDDTPSDWSLVELKRDHLNFVYQTIYFLKRSLSPK